MNEEKAIEHCRRMINLHTRAREALSSCGTLNQAYESKGQAMAYADMIIRIDSGEWD